MAAANRVLKRRPGRTRGLSVRRRFVSSFEVRYLTLRFFTSNSITFLHFPDELITLSFNNLPIIVS